MLTPHRYWCETSPKWRLAMLRGIEIVSIPVKNQAAALEFFTEKLGFKVATNQFFGEGRQRWIELMIPGAETRLALFTPPGHENRIGGFQPVTFRCEGRVRYCGCAQAKGCHPGRGAEEGGLGNAGGFPRPRRQ